MSDPVYIHGLRVADFMKVELVELAFNGPELVVVSGQNAQGKSSLIHAIMAALAGKNALPERPVRDGAEAADIAVDLGDKVVRLRVKPDRSTTLTLESKDGARYTSPQKLLDGMIGNLAFDPLCFAALEPKQQAETLRQLAGLDTAALDQERARVYAQRTEANRAAKQGAAQLAAIPTAPEGTPEADVSVTEIAKRLRAANDQVAQASSLKRKMEACHRELDSIAEQTKQAEETLRVLRERAAKGETVVADLDRQLAAVEVPDVAAITAELEGVEAVNQAVAVRRRHEQKAADVAELERVAAELDAEVAKLDEAKRAALAAAAFPLPDLGVNGDTVTYRGLPLVQASTAERLRVCLSIAAALNPALRVLLVRQGNDLDASNLVLVAEWAKERGFQVLMERIQGDQRPGVEIVAGRVAGAVVAPAPVVPARAKRAKAAPAGEAA